MDTNGAIRNLDGLIAMSQLTRTDHVTLEQSLKHVGQRAMLLDAQEQKAKEEADKKNKKRDKKRDKNDAEPTG